MNWILFFITAWILVGLEAGLRPALELGSSSVAPSFVIPLLVYIALAAPRLAAVWAAVALGLLIDLTAPLALEAPARSATIVGPHVIAFVVATQAVLLARGVLIRRHWLTLGVVSVLAAAVAQIVVTAIFSVRAGYDPIPWDPAAELGARLLSALFTGITGLALFIPFNALAPFMDFQSPGAWATQRRAFY